ncbi:hypothetical protein CYMTET_41655 [Cymbomonas tetramitiformis]|uniref:Peptidase M14 domain-containing protein n=1 Tax=Cymbomonas tetramitiformis TaxID=36881 RepID=A0AAE0C7D5_9CHLO|nr:hypothetical protein CYMTET_41655 [Cymbomonas tetramitiformis]
MSAAVKLLNAAHFHLDEGGLAFLSGGTAAFSEPETSTVRDFLLGEKSEREVLAAVDFHSWGQLILHQPGWTGDGSADDDVPAELKAEMVELTDKMVLAIKQRTGAQYVASPGSDMYAVGGSADDWLYKEGTDTGLGFAIELRDTDATGGYGSFILPASQIEPTTGDVMASILAIVDHVLERHT